MPKPTTKSGERKKDTVYLFIRKLIQEGEYAWFVNEYGRFLIKWDAAVKLYIEGKAKRNPNFKRNRNQRKASNTLRAALLHHYKKDGAKEFAESRKLDGKSKVIERQFQMPPRVFLSLFGTNTEVPDNREHASVDQSDTSGISGSDPELTQEDQSLVQWLHETLKYEVDITPKESPMQGGPPFRVSFDPSLDAQVTSVHAKFVKSGIDLGNVNMVILPDCLLGRRIPGTSSSGWADVIFQAQYGIHLGSTKMYYYPDEREVVVMVKAPSVFENVCKDMGHHAGNSSNTCSDEETQRCVAIGNAQQVQFLRLLVYIAAREGAQQFIEMIFSTSAARLVFNTYKNSQPLPEVVAKDNGHNKTACYLEGVTKRFSEDISTVEEYPKKVNWSELAKAAEEAQRKQELDAEKDSCHLESSLSTDVAHVGDVVTLSSELYSSGSEEGTPTVHTEDCSISRHVEEYSKKIYWSKVEKAAEEAQRKQGVELVCLSFVMQGADINVKQNLLHNLINYLGLDHSEIHLEESEKVGVNCWIVNCRIPKRKEILENLRCSTLEKLSWLNHCGVKAVQIGNEFQILLQPSTRSHTLIIPDCNHSDKNLDLILVIDCALSNPVLLGRLKTQLKYLINDIFDSFHLRLALINYQNHQKHPYSGMRSDDLQINNAALLQNFTDRRDIMREAIENLSRFGSKGTKRGLADGLALAVQLSELSDDINNFKCRKNASKVCILLPMLEQRTTLEIFECEHGHDVMKLCQQLTKNYVTLHIIAITQPIPAYLPDLAHDFMTDFFTGISLKTGGKFFEIPDVKFISQVVRYTIDANISEEHLFGTAYDIVIEEIRQAEGGDVSLEDLNVKLQEGLNRRSFHISRILFDGKLAIGPATKLAKKFLLDEDFPSACETFKSTLEKRRQSTGNIIGVPGTSRDVDTKKAQTTTPQFSLSAGCVITTDDSERILQRVVQRRRAILEIKKAKGRTEPSDAKVTFSPTANQICFIEDVESL